MKQSVRDTIDRADGIDVPLRDSRGRSDRRARAHQRRWKAKRSQELVGSQPLRTDGNQSVSNLLGDFADATPSRDTRLSRQERPHGDDSRVREGVD